jgi:hypothetical protein
MDDEQAVFPAYFDADAQSVCIVNYYQRPGCYGRQDCKQLF